MLSPKTTAVDAKRVMLTEDFFVWTRFGIVGAPRGFIYNGLSQPWLAGVLLFISRFDPRVRAATCIHDYLYKTGLYPRKEADEIYYDLMVLNGIDHFRARVHYAFLRAFGWIQWDKDRKKDLK